MNDNDRQLHAVIQGLVQGVGFRFFVVEVSSKLGLTGWVRNTFDGDVEVLAEGSREQLDQLITRLQQGPRAAHVINVSIEWQAATGEFSDFRVRSSI
ncbi:MAG: acylphosphatase [Anaerolineae bacterium]|nr:acylphosphatase [Anaerolineae bacterium]